MLVPMVISSGAVLGALVDAIERSVNVSGVYDGLEINQVIKDFERNTRGTGRAKLRNRMS